MSTSQEKLAEASMAYCEAQGGCVDASPHEIHELMVGFARERILKAAEIAGQFNNSTDEKKVGATIQREILKLME